LAPRRNRPQREGSAEPLPRWFFTGAARLLGRELTGAEGERFVRYARLLGEWGRVFRLVGRLDVDWLARELLLDSLLFLRVLPASASSVMDLGAGAGIPGIPLKVVREDLELTLVEARRRAASFLSTVVRELGLRGAEVHCARAEDLLPDLAGRFDAVVFRCVGDVERTLRLAGRFLRPGGSAIGSGPPQPRPLRLGEWVTVPDPLRGTERRFAVWTSASGSRRRGASV
jgi:16S rRNA (guanine527-N7)-methyltransferase